MGRGSGRVELKEGVEKMDEGSKVEGCCVHLGAGEGDVGTDMFVIGSTIKRCQSAREMEDVCASYGGLQMRPI